VSAEGDLKYIDLMEATSILLENGQPVALAQLVPGTTIGILGYAGETGAIRAAHIDVLRSPTAERYFAPYRPRNVTLSTLYDGYGLPLSIENISATLPLTQTFSLTQTSVLTQNGFVVLPSDDRTFSSLYNDPRYITYPVFISADSVLHVSQLFFDRVLRSVEQAYLLSELGMLDREMFELSWSQYEAARASATPEQQSIAAAALRNASYFAVALSLLDPEFTPPSVISPVVNAELSLIAASEEIAISPLLDLPGIPEDEKLRVDYSQFTPTGHYSCVDCAWNAYLRAMTWHRLITLRLSQREEMRSAALIAYTLKTHSAPRILWQRVHAPLIFFQGRDASFTPVEYSDLMTSVWGEITDISALADENKMDALIQAARDSPLPDNPMWTFWDKERRINRDWRFLGQPFLIDTYVFQQMTGDHVGDLENRRALPSCIDLAAVLGSLEAYRVALQVGYAERANYIEQVENVHNELAALRTPHWTEELYWNWLYVYRALLQEKNPSYPNWMRTTAWKRKELQTVFGSWTNVRHDTDPAVELVQVQGPEDGSSAIPPWGYVEPQPEVYARLAALTRMIIDGLESRLMLPAADRDALLELEAWLIFLQEVARRELTGQVLTEQEYQDMAKYGALIEKLTWVALGGKVGSSDQALGKEYEAAVAIRVAAGQGEQLMEVTGRVDEIYVVIERGRERYLARGGVYSHYEFVWPDQELLADTRWREMLASGETPPRPAWVSEFVIPE
jgi:hypothetical protein